MMEIANDNHLKEKLEILDGTRGRGTRERAAVRRAELAPLLKVPRQLKSRPVGGAPTSQDYNNLRQDIKMLHDALIELASIQQGNLND